MNLNIMVAGYETTRSLIANTMYLALTRPEHLAYLRRGGRDAARFVDAVNMFDPPIIGWLRKLKEPYGGMPERAVTELAARFPDLRLVPGFVRRNANNVGFRAMLEEPVLLHG
jgi:cytochrome P450